MTLYHLGTLALTVFFVWLVWTMPPAYRVRRKRRGRRA